MRKISVLIDLAMSQLNLKWQIYQTPGAENTLWEAILFSSDKNENIDIIKMYSYTYSKSFLNKMGTTLLTYQDLQCRYYD